MAQRFKTALSLLKETAADWMADSAPRLGAALAYYTVFSISPLMLIVVTIAGLWFGREVASQEIYSEIGGLIGPESSDAIKGLLAHAHKPQSGTLATTIAIVTLLVGSTGVFVELQDALNTIWGVKPKSSSSWINFIWTRVLSFAMVLAIGFLLLVSLVLTAALAALGKYMGSFAPDIHLVWRAVNFVLSFSVITLLFALIFKILPDVRIGWKDVWIGALITAFLFTLGKFALGLYLAKTSIASAYGAAGSVVVILVWVYYSAQILFFGAEFTQVFASHYGRHPLNPVSFAEPMKVEDKVPAALKRRGEIHTDLEELQAPVLKITVTPDSDGPKPGHWKMAVPVAAFFAWMWFKDRNRR